MNKFGNFRCSCGSDNIECSVSFDGCDFISEAGEGSGFMYEISLVCNNCGRAYPIGRIKSYQDFSENLDKELKNNAKHQ